MKLGLMKVEKSSVLFGNEDEMKGEIIRSDFPDSNANVGRLGLLSLGGRKSSDRKA